MLYLSGVQPLAGIFYLAWIVYKIGLCVYFMVCESMTVSHSAGLALGDFLCLSLYCIEVFLQYLGSITMVRVLHLVHLLHLDVNTLMEPGVRTMVYRHFSI